MPTGEEFLSSWTNVVQGGISTPSIVTAVTPIMVTAGEMHQLINTPGVQVTTIPVIIPVTSAAKMAPFTIQSQLWLEGHQPKVGNEERVVEIELDVEQEDSQEEKESKNRLRGTKLKRNQNSDQNVRRGIIRGREFHREEKGGG